MKHGKLITFKVFSDVNRTIVSYASNNKIENILDINNNKINIFYAVNLYYSINDVFNFTNTTTNSMLNMTDAKVLASPLRVKDKTIHKVLLSYKELKIKSVSVNFIDYNYE